MEDYQDFILPDETVETDTPQSDIEQRVEETVEDTKPTETQEETTEEQTETQTEEQKEEIRKLKVKYNHEEMELAEDEAIPLIQKGMNYDKVQEKLNQLQSDPAFSFVQSQADKYGMTVPEYVEAVQKAEEQEQLNELINKNIPEEYAKEMLENRKFRQEQKAKEEAQQKQSKEQQEFNEFLESYPNIKADEIPKEVWELRQNGMPLKYAYMQHEHNQLQTELKTLKQTIENQKKAPVSGVTAHGGNDSSPEDDFLRGFDMV